jgi:Domain of unknown function (DUF397)
VITRNIADQTVLRELSSESPQISYNGENMDTPHKVGKITLSESDRQSLAWLKAHSSTANGACLEIAAAVGNIAIRDSKDPDGPILVYTPSEFRAFLDGARNGEFDSLLP